MSKQIVYVANDNLFILSGVKNALNDAFVNDAVVTLTVKDESGTEVPGITWPLNMNPTGTDGEYSVVVEEGAAFVDKEGYVAFIDAETPGGITGHWECPIGANTRECE